MYFERDPVHLGGLFIKVSSVCASQAGQAAPSARRAIRPPGRVLSDVAAELCLGGSHNGVVCVSLHSDQLCY